MKKWVIFLVLLICGALIFAGCGKKVSKTDKVKNPSRQETTKSIIPPSPQPIENITPADVLKNLQGIWIREEYINTLLKTKSPLQAVKNIGTIEYGIVLLKFQNDENGKNKCLHVYEFHQGDNQDIINFTLISGNSFNLTTSMENYNKNIYNHSLTVDDLRNPTKLTWETKDGKFDFIKIKGNDAEYSTEDFVNNIVLAGKYKDETGQIYVFGQDRVAKWPHETFNYRISLDFVLDRYCFIWVVDDKGKNTGTYYTYEWKDNKLNIFKATTPANVPFVVPESKPILILEKIE